MSMSLALNLLSILSLIVLVSFAIFMGKQSRKGLRAFKVPFGVIVFLGTVLFMYGYHSGPLKDMNFITLLVRSFISSLEMFVSETHLDEIVLENDPGFLETPSGEIFIALFFIIYPAALIISFMTLASLISRGLESKTWLWRHRRFQNTQYIFWGINEHAVNVAKSLISGGGKKSQKVSASDIIFVELPDKKSFKRFSFESVFSSAHESSDIFSVNEKDTLFSDNRVPVLSAREMIHTVDMPDLEELLSFTKLGGLYSRFLSSNTEVFLLDDNEELNLCTLKSFLKAGCNNPSFYCHAGKERLVSHFDDAILSNNVHFVDSAYLAVRELMSSDKGVFHPARFVDVATNEDGHRLGYINGEFNAAIVGFGRVGQEALRYLYEFGSFPDKDGNLAKSQFHVFDGQMDKLQYTFMEKYPGASYETSKDSGRIVFYQADSKSQSFYRFLHEHIDCLNYFVVATGDDEENLSIALNIIDFAYRRRKDGLKNFIVLAHITHSIHNKTLEDDLLKSYQRYPGDSIHIGIFGQDMAIWKYDVVSDKWINSEARLYYEAYQEASGKPTHIDGNHCWDIRAEDSLQYSDNPWKNKRRLFIQEEQDRHNCFHSVTKRLLGSDVLYGKQQYIATVYKDDTTGHYFNPKNPNDVGCKSAFEYLAIGEHLRWLSSYEMNGYTAPPRGEGRDYLKKWHEYMIPYSELSESIRHYDWIPVKIAFAMKK